MSFLNMKHYQEYVYDVAVDGGAAAAYELSAKAGKSGLPAGAVVTAVMCKVVTAFGGGTSMSWGDDVDADGYSGTAQVTAALLDNAVFNGWDNAAALIWDDTNDHQIYNNIPDAASGAFNVTIAGTMTAGKAIFVVEYYMPSLA
jgi:hypothetical protein